VPKSQLNAIITDRTEAYMNQKTDKLIQATTLQWYINNRIEEAKLNYSIEQDKIKYEQQDFSNRLQLFNSLRQTNYQKQSLELQKQSLESGKFTTTPDPLWQWVYVTNTKTWEVTLKSWDEFYPGAESTNQSNSNYPINIQDTQNFYNQKPTQVGASDVDLDWTMNQALTAPWIVTVTKAPYMQTDWNIQMQVKTKDW
jgi:hypothetical protein